MEEANYRKTVDQCQEKAIKLKREYRLLKDKHGKTARGPNNWRYLDKMDKILAHKPAATCPPVLIDTLEEPEMPATMDEANDNEHETPAGGTSCTGTPPNFEMQARER